MATSNSISGKAPGVIPIVVERIGFESISGHGRDTDGESCLVTLTYSAIRITWE